MNPEKKTALSGRDGTIDEIPISPAWIARMLRAIGASTALVVVASMVGFYVSGSPLTTWETPSDVSALGLGVAIFLLADWLSVRNWQPPLLGAFALIVLNYSISAVETKNIGGLFSTLVLILLGSGALNPGSAYWQAGFSAFCVLDWFLATQIFPDDLHLAVDHWITIVAAGALAVFSCYLRRKFERERAEAQRRIRESEVRFRQILDVFPDAVSIVRERDLAMWDIIGRASDPSRRAGIAGKRSLSSTFTTMIPQCSDLFATLSSGFYTKRRSQLSET